MNFIIREISGVHGRQRLAEVKIKDCGNILDIGVLDVKQRIELANHLKDVVERLTHELPIT